MILQFQILDELDRNLNLATSSLDRHKSEASSTSPLNDMKETQNLHVTQLDMFIATTLSTMINIWS